MSREDALREVLALLEKATPGRWYAWDRGVGYHLALDPDGNELLPDGMRTDLTEPDANAIAAAVNFLRKHGPALLSGGKDAVNGMRCTDCGTTGTVYFMCQACSHGNYPTTPEPRA